MSKKEIGISSTCTVFAESEVINQLAMGTDKCDIIAGIHRSVLTVSLDSPIGSELFRHSL